MTLGFEQIVCLMAIGLLAGVLGGLLGVGGSIIMIPGMAIVLHAGSQHLFQAAAMTVNVFVAAPAAVAHWRAGAVVKPIVKPFVGGALVGVISGVALSELSCFKGQNEVHLARVFALFLAYVVVYNIYRLIRRNRLAPLATDTERQFSLARVLAVGLGVGLSAGLTGAGGGALAVPMQQVFLRIPLKNAIANSACTILFSALFGAIYKNAMLPGHGVPLHDSLIIAAAFIPTGFVGSWFGAVLTHRLPREPVRVVFILLLSAGAWKMWQSHPPLADPRPATQPAATAPATQPGEQSLSARSDARM